MPRMRDAFEAAKDVIDPSVATWAGVRGGGIEDAFVCSFLLSCILVLYDLAFHGFDPSRTFGKVLIFFFFFHFYYFFLFAIDRSVRMRFPRTEFLSTLRACAAKIVSS